MIAPAWSVSEDKKTLTMTILSDPPVVLQLDCKALDEMLAIIGSCRRAMLPAYAPTFSTGQLVKAIPNPTWVAEPDAMLGNSIVHLRDSRFGWLHYLFPRDEARKLAQVLQNQANAPPPSPGAAKPN